MLNTCINPTRTNHWGYFSTAPGLIITYYPVRGKPYCHHPHWTQFHRNRLSCLDQWWSGGGGGRVETDRHAWLMCTRPTASKLKRGWWSMASADIRLQCGVQARPVRCQWTLERKSFPHLHVCIILTPHCLWMKTQMFSTCRFLMVG